MCKRADLSIAKNHVQNYGIFQGHVIFFGTFQGHVVLLGIVQGHVIFFGIIFRNGATNSRQNRRIVAVFEALLLLFRMPLKSKIFRYAILGTAKKLLLGRKPYHDELHKNYSPNREHANPATSEGID